MKRILFFSIAIFILSAGSCKKPDTGAKGTVKITFKAFFDNNPLVVFTNYADPNGNNIQFQVFNYFLSHIELVKDNDEVVRLKDIDYADFSNCTNLTKATAGITLSFDAVEAANYKTIRFGVGVEPVQNAQDPGSFPSDPYLGNPGNYWTAWNSYIFSRIEGIVDTLPSAAGGDVFYLYHSGVDGMYQARSFSKIFAVEANQTKELVFNVDLKNVFYKAGDEIDIPAQNVSHSGAVGTAAYDLVKDIITNIADAMVLQ